MSFSALFIIAGPSHSFVSQFSKFYYKQTKNDLKKKKNSLKHVVRKMSGRENVRSGKCLSGEMSSWGSDLPGIVRSRNFPFMEMAIGKVFAREVSVGELPSGKCQSGNCSVGELSAYHS